MESALANGLRQAVQGEPLAVTLGMELKEVREGYARVEMRFNPDVMANIYGKAHGGAIFALMDEAFEVASNSHGNIAVALNAAISYVASPDPGEVLTSVANLAAMTRKTATYEIKISGKEERLIAICQATVYRLDKKPHFVE